MKTVSKSRLKAKMLEYFREVERSGNELIITDNKQPVLKVIPFKKLERAEEIFGKHRGHLHYKGSLTDPVTSEWEEG